MTLKERFWLKVNKTDGCWLWTVARQSGGYGVINIRGKVTYAHRLSFEWAVGPIPEGLEIDHLCRTRNCVRPGHLEPVTAKVNGLRGSSPSADNARKTHCQEGHAFEGSNLYVTPKGDRQCRACRKRQTTEWCGVNRPSKTGRHIKRTEITTAMRSAVKARLGEVRQAEVAREFGLSKSVVCNIAKESA